ncbi:MAG: dihydroorotate dehydrogenase electron transfer subunit [Gammaproteobacteria bacterium]|nr:dihydroorotate dehydrogenase electron transfer subunit [Gammaproteobacteria bacterium]MDH5275445.1 dihydroorotate dehydrogenase electron transfer subunit [Gammaproteobacteria bacterium]
MNKPHRGTIHAIDAEVLEHRVFPGRQFIVRLRAPECARAASAGMFVHVQCGPGIPMRRPLSILRVSPAEGWVELLYKVIGSGLLALSRAEPGNTVSLLGPIGQGFRPDPARPVAILVGGGVGIPPLMFLAEVLAHSPGVRWEPNAFFGSELPFPFTVNVAGGTLTQLDDWKVPAQLASNAGLAGCRPGFVTDLARTWIAARSTTERARMTIYACGPTPMLKATQKVADEFSIPSQLCLEEFMACGVGGCAGCVVPVRIDGQRQMKRVCVDGPVFDGTAIAAQWQPGIS